MMGFSFERTLMAHAASIPVATLTPSIIAAIPLEDYIIVNDPQGNHYHVENHAAHIVSSGSMLTPASAITHTRSENMS
jgi:hypothetical protein